MKGTPRASRARARSPVRRPARASSHRHEKAPIPDSVRSPARRLARASSRRQGKARAPNSVRSPGCRLASANAHRGSTGPEKRPRASMPSCSRAR